jgi:hypothetical protein
MILSSTSMYKKYLDVCMMCGDSTKGKSIIACSLGPHNRFDADPTSCGNFVCLKCFNDFEEHCAVCPASVVVCYDTSGCNKFKTKISPPMVCACGRPVCGKCFTTDEFAKDGMCLICTEQKDFQLAVAKEGAQPPAAKRVKTEDSNGERRV